MRIVGLVHFAVPHRNAGSERVLDELLTAAVNAGHDVVCVATDCGLGPTVTAPGGYPVELVRNVALGANRVRRHGADVILSHHQNAMYAIRQARLMQARSVFLTHNDMDLNKRPLGMGPSLVIHNTEWVKESLSRFPAPGSEHMVMLPTVNPDLHRATPGSAITLVNLNAHKGANLFYRLAELMPNHQFIGVVGGHGVQIVRRDLPNVTIIEHGPDMAAVWSRTRVLLMPSVYESYGLVAAEAAVSGIPTVAARTPGLVENLSGCGIFVGPDLPGGDFDGNRAAARVAADPEPWMLALLALDDPAVYGQASRWATAKAVRDINTRTVALQAWTDWITRV